MDDVRQAGVALHYMLGRELDPPLRPEEEIEAARLKAEIEAAKRASRRSIPFVPRRTLLLMIAEAAFFTGIVLWGTSSWPLAAPGFELFSLPGTEILRTIVSSLTIAVFCLVAMACSHLYPRHASPDRSDLPRRLVLSMGLSLIALAFLVFLAPGFFRLPGLAPGARPALAEWKLILLLLLSFGVVYVWRSALHRFRTDPAACA